MGGKVFFEPERGFDPRPGEGKIQSGYWRGLKTLIRERGGNYRNILERQELDPIAFEDHDCHVDCTSAVNVLEYCSSSLDDPLFGLHLADLQTPDVFGCVATLARAAPTFREALQSLVDYIPIVNSPEGALEFVTSRDSAEIRWSSDLDVGHSEQANFHGVLLIMNTLRALGGRAFRPAHANLAFDPPRPCLDEIQSKVGCKVYKNARSNSICFSSEFLRKPNPSANRMVYNVLGSHLASLDRAANTSLIERVQHYIRTALPTGICTIEKCAEKLGASTRTLQKRLASQDTSFSVVVERQRIEFAKKALSRGGAYTLDEIAYNLGYSDQTSFGRAFKRWTGLSPQAFRAQAGPER